MRIEEWWNLGLQSLQTYHLPAIARSGEKIGMSGAGAGTRSKYGAGPTDPPRKPLRQVSVKTRSGLRVRSRFACVCVIDKG